MSHFVAKIQDRFGGNVVAGLFGLRVAFFLFFALAFLGLLGPLGRPVKAVIVGNKITAAINAIQSKGRILKSIVAKNGNVRRTDPENSAITLVHALDASKPPNRIISQRERAETPDTQARMG